MMQLYRLWDVKENCAVPKDMVLMTDDKTLAIIEKVHKRRKVPGKPVPVYVNALIDDGSLCVDWATCFKDLSGIDIFENDILRIPNKDKVPIDAINIEPFVDYIVVYDKPTGQWVIKFWLNSVLCNYAALYMYAKKGTVVGRQEE